MSYRISSVTIVRKENFKISKKKWDKLVSSTSDLPESSILDPDWPRICCTTDDEYIYPNHVWWSSDSVFLLVTKLLPQFEGEADLVVCWEGGDSYTGIRVKDGVVTKRLVLMSLGKEE